MLNIRLVSLLLAFLAILTEGSHPNCYECEDGEGSTCASGDTTGMKSAECETDRCVIATSVAINKTLRTCFSGNKIWWDCMIKKFAKNGCVDLASETIQKDPTAEECLKAAQGNRKKRDAKDYDTWCFCEGDHCNSAKKLGGNVMLLFGIGALLAFSFA